MVWCIEHNARVGSRLPSKALASLDEAMFSKDKTMQRFLVEPVQQFAGANTRIKKPTVRT
jgi:hypothetical protein